MTNLATILGSETLPTEMLESIQEAFDAKLAEAETRIRAEAETSIREEFSARFNHDKDNLVEAMDKMLTDAVKLNARRSNRELNKVTESRHKLDESRAVNKQLMKSKLSETVQVSNRFITEHLKKSIVSLNEKEKALNARSIQLETAFKKLKKTMTEQQAARIQKMDEFVVRNLRNELTEFDQDHRALNAQRASLVRESKEKLKQTQAKFVTEAAKKVEEAINTNLKREMNQLHEDIERNRQNNFGRRVFEAMADEFMSSYFAEGTEVRKLQNMLESKDNELMLVKSKLTEASKAVDSAARKERLAEDRVARGRVMNELLANLSGDKKRTMGTLLENTKTEGLRAAFDRLMPVVLSEGKAKVADRTKPILAETNRAPARRTVEVSGDKPSRLVENAANNAENEISADLGSILRLAGLSK